MPWLAWIIFGGAAIVLAILYILTLLHRKKWMAEQKEKAKPDCMFCGGEGVICDYPGLPLRECGCTLLCEESEEDEEDD